MEKGIKKQLKSIIGTLKEAAKKTGEYSSAFIMATGRVIGRLVWIISKYALTSVFGNQSQRIQLFTDLAELAYEIDGYRRGLEGEEKSFFVKILDSLNGVIDEHFPEERSNGFQQFKVECVKDLYKSTYNENAFTQGKTYLVLKDWEGNYDIEDNLDRVFNFNHDGTSESMYQFKEYFK